MTDRIAGGFARSTFARRVCAGCGEKRRAADRKRYAVWPEPGVSPMGYLELQITHIIPSWGLSRVTWRKCLATRFPGTSTRD